MRKLALLLLPLAIAACGRDAQPPATATPAAADPSRAYAVHDWPLPAMTGSAQPDLAVTADGRILLSWINSTPGRRNALQFVAMAEDGHWQSGARTIAVGQSMLANWADTPHIAATADGALWVHWLQRTGEGYAYDVVLSRSTDGGFNWSAPAAVNDDGTQAEHGFVSMWPASQDTLGVAWLDGREMAGGKNGMTLRAAVFEPTLQRKDEMVVDSLTCDCCQTSVAMTARGPLLVYRDRTGEEIRDVYATRFEGGAWSAGKPVHADQWKMPACPVNGPSVAADGNDAVVAWYTAADDRPRVQLARSTDAGDSFGAPVLLDEGEAVQGRVAIALDRQQAWVLWLREDTGGQSLWLSRRTPDLARELQRIEVAKLQGRGRGTGFPQVALRNGSAHVAWTDIVDGAPHLRGAVVSPR